MHICIISPYTGMGGIETMLVRMTEWLSHAGCKVTVLCHRNGCLAPAIAQHSECIIDPGRYEAVLGGGPSAARRAVESLFRGEHVDVFYALRPCALWVAAALVNAQAKPSKCLAGVYWPGAFVPGPRLLRVPCLVQYGYPGEFLFANMLPPESRLYMNTACKEVLETSVGRPVPGRIWPLPIDGSPYANLARKPENGLIVSVGRLDPMKEYNLWMIDVIEELVNEGHDVRWEVYGDGMYRRRMEAKIDAKRLNHRIILKGQIPYADLGRAFERARVFLGMGTTLIEAGFARVPAVVATAYDESGTSYGFLQDLPEFACGEVLPRQTRPVGEFLKHALSANPEEYARLSDSAREHARRFELQPVMAQFMQLVDDSPNFTRLWRPTFNTYCATTYRRAVEAYGRRARLTKT